MNRAIPKRSYHPRLRVAARAGKVDLRKAPSPASEPAPWEEDLARLQTKLCRLAGHRCLSKELIEERRHAG
jgi:hypothetical protein